MKNKPFAHDKTTGQNEWLTPRHILDKLGKFDLDPCAFKGYNIATHQYYERGLEEAWFGRVFCNPPYGKLAGLFLKKLERHGNGIGLVFARTDTRWFQSLSFDAINFMKGRVSFINPFGETKTNAGAPSCLIAFGKENVAYLRNIDGMILTRR